LATPASVAGVHFQSFFNPPTGVPRNGKLVLSLGAGERVDVMAFENDGSDANNNHYYVLVDSDPLEKTSSPPDPLTGNLTESDLADNADLNTETCSDLQANYEGYFLTGRDGEKFVTPSTVFMGDLYTGSHVPADPSLNACDLSGTGYIYRFNLECGDGGVSNDCPGPLPSSGIDLRSWRER
jgi:hypothetical protein